MYVHGAVIFSQVFILPYRIIMHAKNKNIFLVTYICEGQKWDDKKEQRKANTSIYNISLDILQLLFMVIFLL